MRQGRLHTSSLWKLAMTAMTLKILMRDGVLPLAASSYLQMRWQSIIVSLYYNPCRGSTYKICQCAAYWAVYPEERRVIKMRTHKIFRAVETGFGGEIAKARIWKSTALCLQDGRSGFIESGAISGWSPPWRTYKSIRSSRYLLLHAEMFETVYASAYRWVFWGSVFQSASL